MEQNGSPIEASSAYLIDQEHYGLQQRVEAAASRVLLSHSDCTNLLDVRIDVDASESVTGQPGSSNANTSSPNVLCTMVNAVIPFVLLFSLKMVFENFLSIFRIITTFGGFVVIDIKVQQLFSAARPSTSLRITTVLLFVLLFYLTYGLYIYDDGFNMKSTLLLQYAGLAHHSFFFTLFILILTDTFVKFVVAGFKMLLCFSGLSKVMKRRISQFLEYVSQMYRCIIPVPQWAYYFIGMEDSLIAVYFNGALLLFYGILKMLELYGLVQLTMKSAFRMVYSTSYGISPTIDEINKAGICSICHENFSSPAKLSCSHIFCVSCIYTWLESENTCPVCRAVVEKKDNSWKSGATSKGIRLC
ncbi:zinc finger, C3HC4 type [Dictyocaulus viviparus]|uniref:Zinc finger, C3HC4 type n=1 Tax=Dictyocaulus viviparus TaxID=29172 RepID=A0A0D8XN53_DICVI|nr:zinc finger, C3HC4 type [Dictyocaulus viviparus]